MSGLSTITVNREQRESAVVRHAHCSWARSGSQDGAHRLPVVKGWFRRRRSWRQAVFRSFRAASVEHMGAPAFAALDGRDG